jgi:hypothetical protein
MFIGFSMGAWKCFCASSSAGSANVLAEPSYASLRASQIFMRTLSWRGPLAKNLYGVTAALLGILLWCWAVLDWAGYSGFVLSLRWL